MSVNVLPSGYILKDDFKILKSLGQGGFGITYLAEDLSLGHKVVIKEFLPQTMATRDQTRLTVSPYTDDDPLYDHLLVRFAEEAKLLVTLRHPNIVKVTRLLKANDTAYFIMEYEEGETLEDYLVNKKKLDEETMLSIILPILDGTKYVHKKGVLHRDIAPDNIYLKNGNAPMLIDFGAARNAVENNSEKLSAIAKDGYSPPEQYTTNAYQKASTDIYAIGAVMYRCMTGNKPATATQRQMALLDNHPDPIGDIVEIYADRYSKATLTSIVKALNLKQAERFQSIEEFQNGLKTGVKTKKSANNKNAILYSLIAISVLIISFFVYQTIQTSNQNEITKLSKKNNHNNVKIENSGISVVTQKSKKENMCKTADYKECTNLGVLYVQGKEVKQDYFKGIEYFRKGCEGKDARGCYNLAIMYNTGRGIKQDYFEAATYYKKACLGGDAKSCSLLGYIFEKGKGLAQDDKKAAEYYAKACDGGNTEGCSNLGYMYENGKGVKQDYNKAAKLYEKMCTSGEIVGCYNLGVMYEFGHGVVKNEVKAAELYNKACIKGDAGGCNNLALLYEDGRGVTKDIAKAKKLYTNACDNNSSTGCFNLGYIHEDLGGVSNTQKAKTFYGKACDLGNATGCSNYSRLNM